MRIHGGAVVPRVAVLGAEARPEHGVPAGGIDEITGAPALARAILALRQHFHSILAQEFDLPRAAAFHDPCTEGAGALKKDGIEARAADLRSEERRVGKECRTRWWPYREE